VAGLTKTFDLHLATPGLGLEKKVTTGGIIEKHCYYYFLCFGGVV